MSIVHPLDQESTTVSVASTLDPPFTDILSSYLNGLLFHFKSEYPSSNLAENLSPSSILHERKRLPLATMHCSFFVDTLTPSNSLDQVEVTSSNQAEQVAQGQNRYYLLTDTNAVVSTDINADKVLTEMSTSN